AQAELVALEILFKQAGSDQVLSFCSLAQEFPIWLVLARASCVDVRLPEQLLPNASALPAAAHEVQLSMGCDAYMAGDSYVSGWPPQQRLSAAGSLAAYSLLASVGSILDTFGVRWWAAHATLLGALRNGGLLPQECDVDIALWRPDAHWLTRPQLRSALASAGIAMFNLPLYFVLRFCPVHVPPEADSRSVDGRVACQPPYIDAHLADVVPHQADRWDYIYRSDTRYGHSFPLAGLFGSYQHGEVAPGNDRRLRWPFGEYFQVFLFSFLFVSGNTSR
ncbi:unnamed protein product, partial [Polarella glacialis]